MEVMVRCSPCAVHRFGARSRFAVVVLEVSFRFSLCCDLVRFLRLGMEICGSGSGFLGSNLVVLFGLMRNCREVERRIWDLRV